MCVCFINPQRDTLRGRDGREKNRETWQWVKEVEASSNTIFNVWRNTHTYAHAQFCLNNTHAPMWNDTVRMANSCWTQNSFTPHFNNSLLSLSAWANTDVTTIREVVLLPLPPSPLPTSERLLLQRNSIYCLMCTDRLSCKDCQILCVNNPHFKVWLNKDENARCPFPPHWGGWMKTTCVNTAWRAALSVHMREETVIRLVSCDKQ